MKSSSTPFCMVDITQHALKGQKLLAQGIALGIMSVSNAPCKGKSFKIHRIKMETPLRYVKLLPLQGARFATSKNPGQMNSSSTHSCIVDITQHALKGQKLLAQVIALGIMSVGNAPCKGKSFKIHLIKKENSLRYVKFLPVVLKLLPLQGARFATHKNPGRCPGLRASALSGRAAYMSLLGVLLI